MSSSPRRTRQQWEDLGAEAILDLLSDVFAAPWSEVEARISSRGWKDFPKVQPVQLSGARRALREQQLIVEDVSRHATPVRMIRLPFSSGRTREQQRLLGRRRKAYRKFLAWTSDARLCGRHAETVVLESLHADASEAGLFVPRQAVGNISEINGFDLSGSPADCYAHVLNLDTIDRAAVAIFEVKNVHEWIYPDSQELWQLLGACAPASSSYPVVPVLVCVRYAYPVLNMAMDLGFFVCALYDQVFSPSIPEDEFDAVASEFGLFMRRHEGPSEPVSAFLTRTLRRSPPASEPNEDIEWFRRQSDRFAAVAPLITAHASLAAPLNPDARRRIFKSFAAKATESAHWPLRRGWS